jgi:hypothetical protein
MRIGFGPGRKHYAARVGIFLVLAALVAGVTACDGAHTYQVTISSTLGGDVVTPGEGTFTYEAGAVVQLVATPDDSYQFRSWTGDITNNADPSAASTTITMSGNYAIVANFQSEGGTGPDGSGGHTQP